jgi:hypothetical protein
VREEDLSNKKSPRTFRRLMRVGGFFVLRCVNHERIIVMSTRRPRKTSYESPHRFDTGFIPTADYSDDHIIVTRNSPLISAVSRKRPGEYRICGGSFIGGGGSREATADEVAEYLARSPHWAHLMRLTLEMGWKDVHLSLAKL